MTLILDCIYIVAGACLLPYWLWKLPQSRRYRAGIPQRLGFGPPMPAGCRRLWVHCASVGEASIPRSLVARLRECHPGWQVVFSTNTDTGARRLRELYPDCPVFFMPLDVSLCARRALRRVAPDAVLLVELEVWPNFMDACRARGVPVGIISGRIGRSSRRLLRTLSRLMPRLWEPLRLVCARSPDDAQGFLGANVPADRVFDCGSLKYDNLPDEPDSGDEQRLRRLFNLPPGTPVVVGGSTHDGEEVLLAGVYRDLKRRHRDVQLVLAPRHVERADQVAAAIRARGFTVSRKSELDASGTPARRDDVILVDTIGDLMACYGLSTCAFVGRSLLPPGGGQNMMEPAALGKPVLVGPYTRNFEPEMALLRAAGAVIVVRSRAELAGQIDMLLSDPRRAERIGRAGQETIAGSRGATERTLARLSRARLFGDEAACRDDAQGRSVQGHPT